jgi:signal transduction histidine kinase
MRQPRFRRTDALAPLGLALLGTGEMFVLQGPGWGWGVAIECAAALTLVWRRHLPFVSATLATAVMLVLPWLGPQLNAAATPLLILSVCGYTLARWIPRITVGLAGIALMLVLFWIDYQFVDPRAHGIGDAVFVGTLAGTPFLLGRIIRKLDEQGRLLKANQELIQRAAVRDERDRIARELHDVIAHSISAMVVQTAAAEDIVRTDPDRAQAMLHDVASTGRQALGETGRLLRMIRDEDDELGVTPSHGLADLPELVEQFRAHGLRVSVADAGPLPPLPAVVDVSAYRIVQEALTNALKYGSDDMATLRVESRADSLTINASNASSGGTGAGGGLGLLGMQERVSLLGGSLSHGVTSDGRFEIAATIPLAP